MTVSATMDAPERAQRIMTIAARLAEILMTENEHLSARRYRDLTETVSEKVVLLANYEAHMNYVQAYPQFALELRTEELSDLIDATQILQEMAEENRQKLQLAIEAGEMMLEMIVQAARATESDVSGYDAKGVMGKGERAVSTPVSVNQRL